MNKKEYAQANRDWLTRKAAEEDVLPLAKGVYYKVLASGDAEGKAGETDRAVRAFKGNAMHSAQPGQRRGAARAQ